MTLNELIDLAIAENLNLPDDDRTPVFIAVPNSDTGQFDLHELTTFAAPMIYQHHDEQRFGLVFMARPKFMTTPAPPDSEQHEEAAQIVADLARQSTPTTLN